ncbi:MAG: InlB B-repeat-containing protein [Floccifex sp.]
MGSEDTVQKDITLYASYLKQSPLDTMEQKTFASKQDVGTDFTITVVCEQDMDLESVKAGIEAKNLTNPDQKDIIEVSGGNNTFIIKGKNPVEDSGTLKESEGFAKGSTYRITLTDSRLFFKGEMESVRDYNFTTSMDEVLNLSLNENVIYLSIDQVRNITNDGEFVESLSIALYTADSDGKVSPTELTQGTFECSKDLKKGDIVAIYVGLRPDKRTLDTPDEECGDVAFVEITNKEGTLYSYKNADAKDVIFKPDILPVCLENDLDDKNNTVTLDNQYLDFSDDVYENIELDSQTTVDVGDFLMFYTGTFGIETGEEKAQLTGKYGKIVNVKENKEDTTTITYTEVDWKDVQDSMDVYANETMSGQEMLENVDTEALEGQIEQQALDSGFAQEAAQYLASLTLATNNFTTLEENMNLSDYKVTLEDGTPVSPEDLQLMDSSIQVKCEMEDNYPKASIGIVPKHFDDIQGTNASKQGLSVELEIKAKITITKSGSDNTLVIHVSGKFVEEVGMKFNTRSEAIWKVWGIFPYIAEFRVTASVDLLNYTGLEIHATMMTKEADENEDDIAEKIKELLKANEENGESEESKAQSNRLVERYSEMLEEETDYLKIVDVNLYETEKYLTNEIPIIAINISVDFIVEVDACVSTGFEFEYITGKRYTFSIGVFGKNVSSDSLTLQEEKYEFCFYVMGRLGIRAGIELEFNVGLFSTKIDSVGVQAAAGAYTKLWGYFYYELHYTASSGKDQSYSGAMLVEVGAFLEAGLTAQVLNGRYSTELKVLDKEWPLWKAGAQDNVLDFTMKQSDMPKIKLKQYIRSTVIPDSVFELSYLDLKDGKMKDAIYEDDASQSKRQNFIITMTNDKFVYDAKTNTITVNPAQGDKKLEGEMIITWVKYPLSFSSKPIQRTISLYWDNVKDGYVIVPYTNGGSYIPIILAKYEAKVKQPVSPEKIGYTFDGWYVNEECTDSYTFPEKMPAQDVNIYAKWKENTDTPYTVEHYKENLNSGEYELFEKETFTGTTNQYVSPEVKLYTGYQSPAKQELKINPDGSSVLRYYYSLEWHTITFKSGEVNGDDIVYRLKYGARIVAPHMGYSGYTFTGWNEPVIDTLSNQDVEYIAQWKKNADTKYRIEYYIEQVDGKYKLQDVIEESGMTNEIISIDSLRNRIVDEEKKTSADETYSKENAIEFENITIKGVECKEAVIDSSGKTIIKVNYKRVIHKVTFDYGYDDLKQELNLCYGANISIPEMKRKGYSFDGWSLDGQNVMEPETKVKEEDVTYIALWSPITYTITFDKNNEQATGNNEVLRLNYDEQLTLPVNLFHLDHYQIMGWSTTKNGNIEYENGAVIQNLSSENEVIVTLYAIWQPEPYIITYYNCEDVQNPNPASYTIESEEIVLSSPYKNGYTFEGWYTTYDYSVPIYSIPKGSAGNINLFAKWSVDPNVEDQNSSVILFYANGGTLKSGSMETRRIPINQMIGNLPVMEKNGYHFDGWYTQVEGGIEITEQSVVTSADTQTLYARFIPEIYTITYKNLEGGFHSNPLMYTIEDAITLLDGIRFGYTFEGWYTNDQFTSEVIRSIPKNSQGNKVFYAKWSENQYKVIFHSNDENNLLMEQDFTYSKEQKLKENEFTREGYTFKGWSKDNTSSSPEFLDKQNVSALSSEKNGVVHLYAVWEVKEYSIRYENMEGVENADDNPVSFTAQNNTITLHEPNPREGYTFGGWYSDVELKQPVDNVLTITSYHDWIFYARWIPNLYTITFDSCLGDSVPTETMLMEYDQSSNLTLMEEMTGFNKPGYEFKGWSTSENGDVVFNDGQTVKNLVSSGNVTLYAIWELNQYIIQYDMGTGAISHNNPESYNIEDGDILLQAPQAKEGYQFIGWFEKDKQIKEIVKGSQKDYQLTAKWAHAGTFYLTRGSDPDEKHNRFIVHRELPEGTLATTNPQHVYYRTLNQSAYGSTVDFTEENDKYHFKHVGGEDVYLTFGPNDMELYFDVEIWNTNTKKDITSVSSLDKNTNRSYLVNLYKVVDTVGGCQGILGNEQKNQYCTLTVSTISNKLQMTKDLYNVYSSMIWQSEVLVTDNGYTSNRRHTIDPTSLLALSANQKQYVQQTASNYGFSIQFNIREKNDGYQWVSFNYGSSYSNDKLAEYHFATKHGGKGTSWRTMSLPTTGASQGDIVFDKGDCSVYNRWAIVDGYAMIDTNKKLNFGFDAAGSGEDDWYYKNLTVYLKAIDNQAPKQVGMAPMAFGQYKQGEDIFITVIYDEVISQAYDLSLNPIEGMPLSNVEYYSGIGTNTLVFKAKVSQDFEITPDLNNRIVSTKPVNGTVKDYLGN